MAESIVVTGIGVVSPLNPNGHLDRFWKGVREGENAVREIRSFRAEAYTCRMGAELPGTTSTGGRSSEDRAHAMARVAFAKAVEDAGFPLSSYDPSRTGIVVGTVLGGILSGERYLKEAGSPPELQRSRIARYPLKSIASRLAERHGLSGGLLTVSTACASGTDAIGLAYRRIRQGGCDAVVAGGVDPICEFAFSGFHALMALTPDKVRPFSRNRNGLALGEGAAFLVLEKEAAVRRRRTRTYGSIAGYGSASDAVHLTAPHREGRGLSTAIAASLRAAKISPEEIEYVNAHGTGTLYNDWMETRALRAILGSRTREVPVSSIKAILGHAFGAAGALEAAVCLLAMRDGVIPPTAHFEEPDPDCDLDCVPNHERRAAVRTAISLSAGFGGQNSALVFRTWER